jgi:hypothetical protein
MAIKATNPYRMLKAAGCKMDSHESDLYVLATPESRRIVHESGWTFEAFVSQIDGKVWLDVPFAWEPFWEGRVQRKGLARE